MTIRSTAQLLHLVEGEAQEDLVDDVLGGRDWWDAYGDLYHSDCEIGSHVTDHAAGFIEGFQA